MIHPLAPPASPDDVEQQFYESLQQGNLEGLMAAWSDDDEIACVHPGGQRVVGVQAVRTSFEAMLADGGVDVRAERVRRVQIHGAAVHHVLERIVVKTAEGTQVGWVVASNVYAKTPQGWRLVLHHASPGSPRELHDTTEVRSVLH